METSCWSARRGATSASVAEGRRPAEQQEPARIESSVGTKDASRPCPKASTVAVATGDVSGLVAGAVGASSVLGMAPRTRAWTGARGAGDHDADLLLDQGTAQAPRAHQGAVTAVYLVRDPLDARVVISCGVDAKVRVWAFGQAEDTFSLTLARQLSTGEHTPTSICPLKRTEMLLAVGHAEGLVSVWAVDEDEPSLRSLCDDGGRRVVRLEARESNVVATDDQGSIMSFGLEKGGSLVPMGSMKGEAPYLALRGLAEAGGPTAVAADGALLQPFAPPRAAARGRGRLRAALAADDAAAEPLAIVYIAVAAPLRVAAAVAAAAGALRGRGAGVASRPRLAVCPPAARGGDAAAAPGGVAADLAVARPRAAAPGAARGGGAAAAARGRRRARGGRGGPRAAAVLVRAPVAVAGGRARGRAPTPAAAPVRRRSRAPSAPAARQPAAVRMRLGLRACTAAGRRPHARRSARRGGRGAGAGPRHEAKGGRGRGQGPGPRLRRRPVPAPAGLRGPREPGARRPRRPTS